MSLRNWLLTGTSLTLFAFAPLGVAWAQDASDPGLQSAFQAFQADQSDANKQALTEACIAAGFQSLDDCIAALSSQAPVEPAAPAEQPSSEQPAPPAEQQAVPVEPSSEMPPPPPEPLSSEEPAPVTEQAAPESSAQEVAPPPASSEEITPPPASSEEAAPASEAPADTGSLAQLTAAVDLYNQGVAELDAGNTNGKTKVDKAKAEIDAICANAGFSDAESCLAQFGLALNPLPPAPTQQPTSSSEEPSSSEVPMSELPNASEVVTPDAVEVLPPDVSAEPAPILDSAKDQQNAAPGTPTEQSSSAEPSSVEPPAPPPPNDQAAQQDIEPPPPEQQSTQTEKGKPKSADFQFVAPVAPANNPDVKILQPPKNDKGSLIFQIGINIYINNPLQERDRFYDPKHGDKIFYEDLSRGRTRETIVRRDGTRIVTIYSRSGDVLQRSKILPNGVEIIIASADQRDRNDGNWEDPGRFLPPLVLNIPARDYILDADQADQEQVDFFLDQPPVEKVRQIYTIDDVKRSARLRDSVRRLEVGGLTFDTGKATISRDQVGALSKVANAMLTLLKKDPGSVFLIEGHTDAVGSDLSNLVLSDQRAATVARILTDFYGIPPENLVTQGYGERYLKVKTDGPEALNRRVTIKNITTLVSYVGDK